MNAIRELIMVQDAAPVKGFWLVSVGRRLREERERLGLSQTSFAACGGQSKRAQIYYEQDKMEPGAMYLAGVAVAGVDVQYVLTGLRSLNVGGGALARHEAVLLEKYRALSLPDRVEAQALVSPQDAETTAHTKKRVRK